MRINHNISAMISQNSLFSANRAMSKTIEKLSTGLRINSAADDAAGLGVSENLRKQVRGMGQALKNTQDTIALLNVADGALNEQSEILQRMRELVIQAKNDTMTDTERGYISQEFTGLMGELNRIAGVTNYNGMQIFAAPLVDRLGGGSPGLYGGTFTDADPNRAHFGRELFGAGNEDEHVFGADDYSSSRYFNMMIGANIDATDTMDPTTFSFASNAANMMTIELGDMSANGLLNINPGNNMVNAFLTFFNDFDSKFTGSTVGDTLFRIASTIAGQTVSIGEKLNLIQKLIDGDTDSINATFKQTFFNTGATTMDPPTGLERVNTMRAKIGALINRLESNVNNLMNQISNTQAAESLIRDTDFAGTTSELSRNQIIMQSSNAMLAQANMQPSIVLQLLGR